MLMIKKLLSMAAMALIAVSANADILDLSLADLKSGWGSSYDAATKTITYESAWTGRGWWLESDGKGADYSKYDEVVVEFESSAFDVKIVIEYIADGATSSDATAIKGATKVTCPLNETYKNAVKQIYLQNGAAGTLTLTAAYLQNAAVFDPTKDVTVWEGTEELKGWSGALTIPCSSLIAEKIQAGDKLKVSYNTTGGSFKVIYVTQGWAWTDWTAFTSLPGVDAQYGTLYADKDGFLEIPINEDALKVFQDNRELKVQGDGITVTSVEIIRANGQSGIADIVAEDENAPVEYFNLQGVRVENPANGLFIRRQGNKVTKVIL